MQGRRLAVLRCLQEPGRLRQLGPDRRRERAGLSLRDHWARTELLWRDTPEQLAWHVTFEAHPEVGELAAALAPALDRPYLDVVPPEWLHLTLADATGEPTAELAAPPVEVTLGPPHLVDEGVWLPAHGAEPLRAALPGVEPAPFHPHVSLAYANAVAEPDVELPEVRLTVTIDALTLLRLRRNRGLYSWSVVAKVPLTG